MRDLQKSYGLNIFFENIFYKGKVFLQSSSSFRFILVLTSAMYMTAICFNLFYIPLAEYDIQWHKFPTDSKSLSMFIMAITVAPVFETWLCQYLPYKLLCKIKYFRERKLLILIAAALFFGINHIYSIFYVIYGTLIGFVIMFGYMVRVENDKNTFWLISACHSLLNVGAFLISRCTG
jgi:hypothetical protein